MVLGQESETASEVGCWCRQHPLCPCVSLASVRASASKGISFLARCRGAFGKRACDGRRSREKTTVSPLGRDASRGRTAEPWDVGSFCVSVTAAVIWGVGTHSKSCWPCQKPPVAGGCIGAGLRRGVTSRFPPGLEARWRKHPCVRPHDAVELPEQQSGLWVCSRRRVASGESCGAADVLAARCYPGNCLSSPEF